MRVRDRLRVLAELFRSNPAFAAGGTIEPRQHRDGEAGPLKLADGCGYRVTMSRPREHDFELHEVLDEPGISDVDHGRWARRRALCGRCGDERRVWRSVSVSDLNRVSDCGVGRPSRMSDSDHPVARLLRDTSEKETT